MTTRILCDFDGTVTEHDNIIALMKEFAPQEAFEPLKKGVLDRSLSIRSGVGQMFRLLPSDRKQEYIDFLINRAVIRPGFDTLLAFAKSNGIDFAIVSGGIDFFVQPILACLLTDETIYCNGSDFSEETVRIEWPHACDAACNNQCGCCKTSIARKLKQDGDTIIAIGDSVTDFELAKKADHVYARGYLITLCEQHGIPYTPFETFYDIVKHLQTTGVHA
ncbi:2-hydroxy-3-keto-5-methylthiopentenyl-1-phosphate phosphatase [Exiguobacterium sp. s166]|uniref:2-hydroxy-3-keto-5-methylthiopentenyl-1- phosphate phosphatase n=1 Tax=Exiguobacterium sp. s166 TaxID=2751204 RepID=UPI001BEA40F7|nr:2-hydroxy-3-keto-5-methylthiopentenyl-1-phosphate phosphatase [Exiguobacterium sp. s166]